MAEEKDAEFLHSANLAALCIVSKVTVTTDSIEGEQVEDCLIPCTIAVKVSEAPKCPRCWNHDEHIGAPATTPSCATGAQPCWERNSLPNDQKRTGLPASVMAQFLSQ